MSIQLLPLIEEKAARFGASQSSQQFQRIFLDAVNYAIGDINDLLNLSTDAATAPDGEVDLDEQQYKAVLSFGIDWYMSMDGTWSIRSERDMEAAYKRKLAQLHMAYMRGATTNSRMGDLSE